MALPFPRMDPGQSIPKGAHHLGHSKEGKVQGNKNKLKPRLVGKLNVQGAVGGRLQLESKRIVVNALVQTQGRTILRIVSVQFGAWTLTIEKRSRNDGCPFPDSGSGLPENALVQTQARAFLRIPLFRLRRGPS